MARAPTRAGDRETTPGPLPEVTPTRAQPHTHDFTLQAVVEMQRSLGDLTAKVDRLILDVSKQGEKVSDFRETLAMVKGAMWVLGILSVLVVPLFTWFLNHTWPAAPVQAQPAAVQAVPLTAPVK